MPTTNKTGILYSGAALISALASILGITPSVLTALIVLFVADFITGAAAAWKTGTFHSGWKTLLRCALKLVGYIGVFMVAYAFAAVLSISEVSGVDIPTWVNGLSVNFVVLLLTINEAVSIMENAIVLGVPIPEGWTKLLGGLKVFQDRATNAGQLPPNK